MLKLSREEQKELEEKKKEKEAVLHAKATSAEALDAQIAALNLADKDEDEFGRNVDVDAFM